MIIQANDEYIKLVKILADQKHFVKGFKLRLDEQSEKVPVKVTSSLEFQIATENLFKNI